MGDRVDLFSDRIVNSPYLLGHAFCFHKRPSRNQEDFEGIVGYSFRRIYGSSFFFRCN